MMTYLEIFAIRIFELCEKRKITLNKLATLSGMKQSTLDNIVKGNTKIPGIRTLHRISQGLGITLSELLNIAEFNELQIDDE